MMNSLIIDCSAGMSIYILKENEIFSFVDENEKRHTDDLLVVVDDLLRKANLKISDIKKIGVCVGPGSFTGVRVAISICKGLSIGMGAKVYAFSNFDCFGEIRDGQVFVLEGFSKFVYARIKTKEKTEEMCVEISELAKIVKCEKGKFKVFVHNEKMQNLLKNYEISAKIVKNDEIFAFNQKVSKNEETELNQIQPVYLRASQAEIEREKKLGGAKND